jgi:hypothetical protein
VSRDPAGFGQAFPARTPVDLLIADGYVAAVRLVIRDEETTAWEPAITDGRVLGEVDDRESFDDSTDWEQDS